MNVREIPDDGVYDIRPAGRIGWDRIRFYSSADARAHAQQLANTLGRPVEYRYGGFDIPVQYATVHTVQPAE